MNANRPILQASWRVRQQKVGLVLLALVGATMIAALYLSVSSQATLVGREIQVLEGQISLTRESNANLKTELARLLCYEGKEPINLTDDTARNINTSFLPVEYSQSLFEWFGLRTQRGSSQ